MKTLIVAVSFASFVLTASTHTRYEHPQTLGRHDSDNVTSTVPESAPTFALGLVGGASIVVVAAYLRGKKSRA